MMWVDLIPAYKQLIIHHIQIVLVNWIANICLSSHWQQWKLLHTTLECLYTWQNPNIHTNTEISTAERESLPLNVSQFHHCHIMHADAGTVLSSVHSHQCLKKHQCPIADIWFECIRPRPSVCTLLHSTRQLVQVEKRFWLPSMLTLCIRYILPILGCEHFERYSFWKPEVTEAECSATRKSTKTFLGHITATQDHHISIQCHFYRF